MADKKDEKPKHKVAGQHVYDGVVMNCLFTPESIEKAKNATFYKEDVIIASYPKSGTAWVMEIVWLLVNKFDFKKAESTYLEKRHHFLEVADMPPFDELLKFTWNELPPRIIKTHLSFKQMQNAIEKTKPKVIVVMRNPKDVLVSYYHFYRLLPFFNHFKGTWNEIFELFKSNELCQGAWMDHVTDWWRMRGNPGYFFVKYEDLKTDFIGTVEKMATFLRIEVTKAELEKLFAHSKFDAMKENKSVNGAWMSLGIPSESKHMRKGVIGDWKNYFTPEQNTYMETIIEEVKQLGLKFEYE